MAIKIFLKTNLKLKNKVKHILQKAINFNRINYDLFIIGHNDGLSELAEELCSNSICLKTCEYIEIECPGNDWSDIFIEKGRVTAQFHPKVD